MGLIIYSVVTCLGGGERTPQARERGVLKKNKTKTRKKKSMVALFLLYARILGEGSTNPSLPVLFLKVENSSHAPFPFSRPGFIHSGSSS